MAKDPAFLFYTKDFLTGTNFFTNEQVGKYIRLLCYQHQYGRLEEKHMLGICGAYDADIYSKFIRDEDGKYFNERLESESNKRNKYVKSRAENASRKKAYAEHMGNANANVNNVVSNVVKLVPGVTNTEVSTAIWENQMKYFLGNEQWIYKFSTQKGIGKAKTEELMREFVNDIDLKQDFKDQKELTNHFVNWYNKKRKDQPAGKKSVAEQAIELLHQKRANGTA